MCQAEAEKNNVSLFWYLNTSESDKFIILFKITEIHLIHPPTKWKKA